MACRSWAPVTFRACHRENSASHHTSAVALASPPLAFDSTILPGQIREKLLTAPARGSARRKIGSGSVGHVYAGKYEQHPVAIKQHRLDGSQLDAKAMVEFEIEVRATWKSSLMTPNSLLIVFLPSTRCKISARCTTPLRTLPCACAASSHLSCPVLVVMSGCSSLGAGDVPMVLCSGFLPQHSHPGGHARLQAASAQSHVKPSHTVLFSVPRWSNRRHHCPPVENAWFSKTNIILQVGKMTAVNHPCIVRCFGMLEPTPGIVLELVDGGSLFQIIHARRDESFSQYEQRLPWPVRKPTEPLVASRLASPRPVARPFPSDLTCLSLSASACETRLLLTLSRPKMGTGAYEVLAGFHVRSQSGP
jgi:hypothetical protein